MGAFDFFAIVRRAVVGPGAVRVVVGRSARDGAPKMRGRTVRRCMLGGGEGGGGGVRGMVNCCGSGI